jgi:uncharacterized membrane protein HdeD (DUF308 family)
MNISIPAHSLANAGISLHDVRTAIHAHWQAFLVTGIVMVVLGILAVTLRITAWSPILLA